MKKLAMNKIYILTVLAFLSGCTDPRFMVIEFSEADLEAAMQMMIAPSTAPLLPVSEVVRGPEGFDGWLSKDSSDYWEDNRSDYSLDLWLYDVSSDKLPTVYLSTGKPRCYESEGEVIDGYMFMVCDFN